MSSVKRANLEKQLFNDSFQRRFLHLGRKGISSLHLKGGPGTASWSIEKGRLDRLIAEANRT